MSSRTPSSLLLRCTQVVGTTFLLLLATAFTGFAPSVHAASPLTVTTTADPNPCTAQNFSLRCALNKANTDGSGDTINFNIPSSDPGCTGSVCTISITDALNPLPTLTANTTTINGYSQPGARPNSNPLSSGNNAVLKLRLDGGQSLNVFQGLGISGNGDTIKGLSITDFTNGIFTSGSSTGLMVQGNFIGIKPDGSTQASNGQGIVNNASGKITTGGTSPASSNVISGNASFQVSMGSADTLQGNIIGLNAAGNAAVVNFAAGGIPGDGILAGPGSVIGGTASGAGNVISGNASGIRLAGSTSGTALVVGNLIGTDVTGKKALGNEEGITTTINNATIGGTTASARNIISGNFNFGITLAGQGNVIEGNYIGTDSSGEIALPNGTQPGFTQGAGIELSAGKTTDTANNTIGGTTSAARNVISGNTTDGVQIDGQVDNGTSGNTKNNLVTGNFIGLDATGSKALGNGGNGVFLGMGGGQVVNNAVKNNVIAHNGKSGILVGTAATDTQVHTPISQNQTFANGGLGIDLAPQGVINANTPPPGPNDYTPAPVITQATTTQISGTAPANTTVEVFLASNEADDQGHGEGQAVLGSVTASAAGKWSLTLTAGQVAAGKSVTATTTTSGTLTETSEFAANVTVH
ncbi:hypothetical protein EPA93_31550 [Ktedonosporobacter rubrisoli]|uniref:CSLREA domain-containing protein n=1 Tax=Ktedonosporobacter rubrisoli TaxID=2509675 RepID=A0A4V0YZM8_KTERU|nr:hypothetical protein [Ktedonosporobacter rubrisoli]QBD80271.1 hypothetical protein EPA93_31550 [Ktedonosporobacter rubrisoli]